MALSWIARIDAVLGPQSSIFFALLMFTAGYPSPFSPHIG